LEIMLNTLTLRRLLVIELVEEATLNYSQ